MLKLETTLRDDKIFDSCSVFGMMNKAGKRFSGQDVIKATVNMQERTNGLGGGFAIYGLYPQFRDKFAFHIMYLMKDAISPVEEFLKSNFKVILKEEIPTKPLSSITNPPLLWRYFLDVAEDKKDKEEDYVVEKVMTINTGFKGAFVFSSGKNMGVFKGVGLPKDIAKFFCLEDYQGYLWLGHGRFPTNTPGWWGGAHPFNILDWSVIHNGELSSYGINVRCLTGYGYQSTLQTDTEVVAYAADLLMRRHKLPVELAACVLAAPLWEEIERSSPAKRALLRTLRQVYGSLLLNGPFSVIIANRKVMIGLTDRIKLRPLTAGVKDETVYISSEESAIHLVCNDLEKSWTLEAGKPVVARLEGKS